MNMSVDNLKLDVNSLKEQINTPKTSAMDKSKVENAYKKAKGGLDQLWNYGNADEKDIREIRVNKDNQLYQLPYKITSSFQLIRKLYNFFHQVEQEGLYNTLFEPQENYNARIESVVNEIFKNGFEFVAYSGLSEKNSSIEVQGKILLSSRLQSLNVKKSLVVLLGDEKAEKISKLAKKKLTEKLPTARKAQDELPVLTITDEEVAQEEQADEEREIQAFEQQIIKEQVETGTRTFQYSPKQLAEGEEIAAQKKKEKMEEEAARIVEKQVADASALFAENGAGLQDAAIHTQLIQTSSIISAQDTMNEYVPFKNNEKVFELFGIKEGDLSRLSLYQEKFDKVKSKEKKQAIQNLNIWIESTKNKIDKIDNSNVSMGDLTPLLRKSKANSRPIEKVRVIRAFKTHAKEKLTKDLEYLEARKTALETPQRRFHF